MGLFSCFSGSSSSHTNKKKKKGKNQRTAEQPQQQPEFDDPQPRDQHVSSPKPKPAVKGKAVKYAMGDGEVQYDNSSNSPANSQPHSQYGQSASKRNVGMPSVGNVNPTSASHVDTSYESGHGPVSPADAQRSMPTSPATHHQLEQAHNNWTMTPQKYVSSPTISPPAPDAMDEVQELSDIPSNTTTPRTVKEAYSNPSTPAWNSRPMGKAPPQPINSEPEEDETDYVTTSQSHSASPSPAQRRPSSLSDLSDPGGDVFYGPKSDVGDDEPPAWAQQALAEAAAAQAKQQAQQQEQLPEEEPAEEEPPFVNPVYKNVNSTSATSSPESYQPSNTSPQPVLSPLEPTPSPMSTAISFTPGTATTVKGGSVKRALNMDADTKYSSSHQEDLEAPSKHSVASGDAQVDLVRAGSKGDSAEDNGAHVSDLKAAPASQVAKESSFGSRLEEAAASTRAGAETDAVSDYESAAEDEEQEEPKEQPSAAVAALAAMEAFEQERPQEPPAPAAHTATVGSQAATATATINTGDRPKIITPSKPSPLVNDEPHSPGPSSGKGVPDIHHPGSKPNSRPGSAAHAGANGRPLPSYMQPTRSSAQRLSTDDGETHMDHPDSHGHSPGAEKAGKPPAKTPTSASSSGSRTSSTRPTTAPPQSATARSASATSKPAGSTPVASSRPASAVAGSAGPKARAASPSPGVRSSAGSRTSMQRSSAGPSEGGASVKAGTLGAKTAAAIKPPQPQSPADKKPAPAAASAKLAAAPATPPPPEPAAPPPVSYAPPAPASEPDIDSSQQKEAEQPATGPESVAASDTSASASAASNTVPAKASGGLPFGQWRLVRLKKPKVCDACQGEAEQETVDGIKEVFQCDVTLQPGALAAVVSHHVTSEAGQQAPRTWVFCPDPLCLDSKPTGSSLPSWPKKMPLEGGAKITRNEYNHLLEMGLDIAVPKKA